MRTTSPARRCSVLAAGLLAMSSAWLALSVAQDAGPGTTVTMGPDETCLDCHAGLAEGVSIHDPVETEVCEACHEQADSAVHEFGEITDFGETCLICHEEVEGAVVHQPVAETDCTACHDPHHSQSEFLLVGDGVADVCGRCHERQLGLGSSHVHSPVALGACTVCHSPHVSETAALLTAPLSETCLSCHDAQHDRIEGATFVHAPVSEDCSLCHDAHASEHPFQLVASGKDLCLCCHDAVLDKTQQGTAHAALDAPRECLECHKPHEAPFSKQLARPIEAICLSCHDEPLLAADGHTLFNMKAKLETSQFWHRPLQEGRCSACHDPHGAPRSRLLRYGSPTVFYAAWRDDAYALCFQCHERRAFEMSSTDSLTGFRDGTRNLHHLHVYRDTKGRTCRACHDIHASNLPKHVVETVSFGAWEFRVQYEFTLTGGSCAPGCHVKRSYDRGTLVRHVKPVTPDSAN